MRQLRGEDARFVYGESGHANSNITLISIYDPSTARDGTVHFKELLKHIETRLHLSPIFRQKLLRVPLELDFPYWIEDESFDLEYHVRHIALPKPGDWRQFCIQASRIHARPLDLSKPLWELYLVEGLDSFLHLPKDSFAILAKIHHAAIDVRGGSEIMTLLHDTTVTPPAPEPPEPWFPESPPGSLSLLSRAMINNVVRPLMFAGPLARAVGRITPAVLGSIGEMLRSDRMPVTRFNSEVSPHRVFDSRRFFIRDFKRIRALVPGATVNDAVLAVCGGALRRYLRAHEELPPTSLVSLAPLSIRTEGADGDMRQELSLIRVALGTEIENPLKRLRAIHRHTSTHKDLEQAIGAKELTDIDKHAPAATLALSARLVAGSSLDGKREPLAGCTIMNVPGPAVPLYFDGARMTYFSAIMPIADGMGLVFAVTSYDGMIFISPTSCREQLPDPEFFAQCIRDSFQDLLAIADQRTAKKKKPGARRAPAKKAANKRKAATKRAAA
jgi:WS/DGAT/MGAT family acyltransferase